MLKYAVSVALMVASCTAAQAGDGTVSARYAVSFMGLPIGQSELKATGKGATYQIALSAKVTGVAAIFAGGFGSGTASGRIDGNKVMASRFDITVHSKNKVEKVAMTLANGTVGKTVREPDVPPAPDIEPVTAQHLTGGVVDPLSGALFVAAGNGPVLAPATCERRAKVFDGKQRFDLIFSYVGTETLDMAGYKGDALVCSMRYEPIAGHAKARRDLQAMRSRVSEITLVPVQGSRTLMPARIVIPFAMGRGVAMATELDLVPK